MDKMAGLVLMIGTLVREIYAMTGDTVNRGPLFVLSFLPAASAAAGLHLAFKVTD